MMLLTIKIFIAANFIMAAFWGSVAVQLAVTEASPETWIGPATNVLTNGGYGVIVMYMVFKRMPETEQDHRQERTVAEERHRAERTEAERYHREERAATELNHRHEREQAVKKAVADELRNMNGGKNG